MAELTCKHCSKPFQSNRTFTHNNGAGQKPMYCSLRCRKMGRTLPKCERQRAMYRELKLIGATAAMAQYGSNSKKRFEEVKASVAAGKDVPGLPPSVLVRPTETR